MTSDPFKIENIAYFGPCILFGPVLLGLNRCEEDLPSSSWVC